jgi:hypothetical protein
VNGCELRPGCCDETVGRELVDVVVGVVGVVGRRPDDPVPGRAAVVVCGMYVRGAVVGICGRAPVPPRLAAEVPPPMGGPDLGWPTAAEGASRARSARTATANARETRPRGDVTDCRGRAWSGMSAARTARIVPRSYRSERMDFSADFNVMGVDHLHVGWIGSDPVGAA